jgi:hypothetical protein
MFGGAAIVCPECSNQWTLSPAVSRSWYCPKCGGARSAEAAAYFCRCGHPYGDHHTAQDVKASRGAFGLSLAELGQLDAILVTEPEPDPQIGKCRRCDCQLFRLEPPHFSAAEFLALVWRQANNGSGGRNIERSKNNDATLTFSEGSRWVRLRATSEEVVTLLTPGGRRVKGTFTMGHSTVGECVIAVISALRMGSDPPWIVEL